MAIVLGIDLGTTTLTAVALDAASGNLSCCTEPNGAETTAAADRVRGRSEWNAAGIAAGACACLRGVAEQLGARRGELAGLGVTGQQHGVVLVDAALRPLTPFINWQDRRGDEPWPGTDAPLVEHARQLAGADAPRRTGCRLSAGYLAVTLLWLKVHGALPQPATACFLPDYFTALLTGREPVTDPTCAASGGVLDVTAGDWDASLLAALDLPRAVFPAVRPSGERRGGLTAEMATRTGLPAGLPVFVGIGDNQASFLGSVARRDETVLVNVGTGGQVSAWSATAADDPLLETRPFPGGGFLLVSAGLSGGAAYAVLERFFRATAEQLLGVRLGGPLYARLNELAAAVPRGADGLRCEPFFTGTRSDADVRASWTGVSAENLTPGHLARALLEGMARTFAGSYEPIRRALGRPARRLVGSGNGIRANPLLARLVSEEFGLPLAVPVHTEEAACGAALLAAVGAGLFADLAAAGALIRYEGLRG